MNLDREIFFFGLLPKIVGINLRSIHSFFIFQKDFTNVYCHWNSNNQNVRINSVTLIQVFCMLRTICSRCAFQIWFTTENWNRWTVSVVSGALYSKRVSILRSKLVEPLTSNKQISYMFSQNLTGLYNRYINMSAPWICLWNKSDTEWTK